MVSNYHLILPQSLIKYVYNHDGFHTIEYQIIDLTKGTYKRLSNKDTTNIQFVLGNQQQSKININVLDTVRWYRPTTLVLWTAFHNKDFAKNHIINVAHRLYRKDLLPLCRGCQHLTVHKYCSAYGTDKYCSGEIYKEIYVSY